MTGTLFVGISERFLQRYNVDYEQRARLAADRLTEEAMKSLAADRRQIDELQRANEELRLQLKIAANRRGKPQNYAELNPADRELISQLKTGEDQLQIRLGNLEGALMNSPEKALSTFVIKQQVDALQERNRSDMESVHGEMGRLFTLTEWCLGLMFTITLSLLALGLANLRRGDKAAEAGNAAK